MTIEQDLLNALSCRRRPRRDFVPTTNHQPLIIEQNSLHIRPQLQKAAASYSAQLDRAEMIERARTIAASKKINAIAEALEKEQAATALAAAK